MVRVRDTGIGIAPEMLPHVFDLFTQADARRPRSQGGLGIGLTLVRRLVEMHGGSVEAHSAGLGRGSEFVVRLPALAEGRRRAGSREGRRERRGRPPGASWSWTTTSTRPTAWPMLLRLWGHEVRVAHDGPAGPGRGPGRSGRTWPCSTSACPG